MVSNLSYPIGSFNHEREMATIMSKEAAEEAEAAADSILGLGETQEKSLTEDVAEIDGEESIEPEEAVKAACEIEDETVIEDKAQTEEEEAVVVIESEPTEQTDTTVHFL